MSDFTVTTWAVLCFYGFLVGVSKNGIPGIGILVAVLMLFTMEQAKEAVGFLLPMLIAGDICALTYYRRHAVWAHVLKLLPWAMVGILIGYFALGTVGNNQLRHIIGLIVITLLGIDFWRNTKGEVHVPTQWWFAGIIGVLAGIMTVMANAAGPLVMIYFLAMRLDKHEFIGTGAWCCFSINWLKGPLFWSRGMITLDSLKGNLVVLPAVVLGAVAGILVLRRIPQKWFVIVVKVLAVAAALKLLFS